jgi:hypothetical protein
MRSAKVWMLGAFLAAALAGTALLSASSFSSAEPVRERAAEGRDHWQHHDGHWSYWSEGDKRWYYTDGSHWYANDGARRIPGMFTASTRITSSAPTSSGASTRRPRKAPRSNCLGTASIAASEPSRPSMNNGKRNAPRGSNPGAPSIVACRSPALQQHGPARPST